MERPSLLVLVRHAESLRNRVKKHNTYFPDEESRMFVKGIADHKIPLTEFGIEQSIMKVRMSHLIRERNPGFTYDMTGEEAEAAFPWLQEYWETCGGFFATPPGGESLELTSLRVYLFLNMLFREKAGDRVLVVNHGGTIRCFRFLLEKWNYDQAEKWPSGQSPQNCGFTVYEYEHSKKRLELKEYNTVCW